VVSAYHAHGPWVNFPYVSRDWIERVGWYACPQTHHYCWDTVMELLGEATRIDYAKQHDFEIEHDAIQDGSQIPAFEMDCVQFLSWVITTRREIVQKLRAAM
jgi:hypothetical protein